MNLTDEQKTALNVGLATWEGWTKCDPEKFGSIDLWHKQGEGYRLTCHLYSYCGDLNAINRLEKRLTDEEHKRHRIILWQLTTDGPNEGYEHVTDKQRRAFVSASAEQRAIALAKTLNLNIEGVTQ